MGSELIAHEFSKIQLVGQKYQDKTTLASKTRFSNHCFGFQSQCFSLLVGYNIIWGWDLRTVILSQQNAS